MILVWGCRQSCSCWHLAVLSWQSLFLASLLLSLLIQRLASDTKMRLWQAETSEASGRWDYEGWKKTFFFKGGTLPISFWIEKKGSWAAFCHQMHLATKDEQRIVLTIWTLEYFRWNLAFWTMFLISLCLPGRVLATSLGSKALLWTSWVHRAFQWIAHIVKLPRTQWFINSYIILRIPNHGSNLAKLRRKCILRMPCFPNCGLESACTKKYHYLVPGSAHGAVPLAHLRYSVFVCCCIGHRARDFAHYKQTGGRKTLKPAAGCSRVRWKENIWILMVLFSFFSFT